MSRNITAEVDELIRRATEAAGRFAWASWVPDPRDEVVEGSIRPPLMSSMVLQYASLRAWLDGRTLTQPHVDAVAHELAAAWRNARMTGIYAGVADVLRDLVLWNVVARMSSHRRDAVRGELVRRRGAAAVASVPPPAKPAPRSMGAEPVPAAPAASGSPRLVKTPRVRDAKKDWMREHGPGYTAIFKELLQPIPPIKLSP
ncbi:MAG TPA: hypothetical protein VE596_15425 [Gaiellaceae bacterium]|nr:hypothetical protein [Gaiellaceae bacterium]